VKNQKIAKWGRILCPSYMTGVIENVELNGPKKKIAQAHLIES
jgi:hypothetical protein